MGITTKLYIIWCLFWVTQLLFAYGMFPNNKDNFKLMLKLNAINIGFLPLFLIEYIWGL